MKNIQLDDELLDRLKVIVAALGGRNLPVEVVIVAMLREVVDYWGAIAAARDTVSHT